MKRPAKPPVRYAYAVCNAQGKIVMLHGSVSVLSIWKLHRLAKSCCEEGQHVERVRVSIAKGTK